MYCCNNRNRCCRCCTSGNNGTASGSLFSGLSLSDLSGSAAGGRQVYLTIPAFLWSAGQEEDDDDTCGCGCC